jgi:glutamate dehydrogenase
MAANLKMKVSTMAPAATKSPRKLLQAPPSAFIHAFYNNVLSSDLEVFTAAEKNQMAASVWVLAAERKPGQVKIRLYNPSPSEDGWAVDHTVLEIINDDMPFLVDSVVGNLQRRGLTVHLVIHPVMQIVRDDKGKLESIAKDSAVHGSCAESLMHIHFDHCLDPALLAEIEKEIVVVLKDVRAAVEDWQKMRDAMVKTIAAVQPSSRDDHGTESANEAIAFMKWLDENNFTYLGSRFIDLRLENGQLTSIKVRADSGLGILRDKDVRMFGGLRDLDPSKTPALQSYVRQHDLLVVTKTNPVATVHRQVPMDAIFIRSFNNDGQLVGEQLFVGLFTSKSYSHNPAEMPFIRRKINYVVKRAGFRPAGHDYKVLQHILKTYPHDELFQISETDLYNNAMGIQQLQERAHVALFVRRDPFERFVTCLTYVPRDRYDSALRMRIQDYFEKAFGGKAEDWLVRIDDSVLARTFITIRLTTSPAPQPNIKKIEADLREMCRSWRDYLRDNLAEQYGEASALALLRRYGEAFTISYREAVEPAQAVTDIALMERRRASSNAGIMVDLSLPDEEGRFHLKLFHDRMIALSEALPIIENLGLKIEFMGGPYAVIPQGSKQNICVHEFVGRAALPLTVGIETVKPMFEELLTKIWNGEVENDPFNALTLRAGLAWREIVILRASARYLRQLRIPYSHEAIAQTMLKHPAMAQELCALFLTRHNPELKGNRQQRCKDIEARLIEDLAKVTALEEDRIMRRYINLVQSSLRTNFFQMGKDGQPKSYLSFKFDSRMVEFMPLPKPLYEIFVYSPRVEAVHLRGGKVARGGIRWSDRREDFRNEILGLMKAQQVKNTVIVPVGSKGGFVVKCPPAEADKQYAEGVECYRTLIRGMLDITDNRVSNKIVPPENVVRHDHDDPYLVVAADKGTAKFSDIANALAQEYGFWLDDAFASGGSVGYDHKGMGITARGAWEAVKRHFREIGKDIQTTDFTCVGVGDMSGDVFGNGMLLSEHTCLLAAFDHRHIFCDPNPNPATSFAERKRMFALPRSSWADYDTKKISKGGGVFSRNEKSIKLTAEMKKAYGVTADSLSPSDLIQAILKAEVELLYFGGIGTYVKAIDESHEEVGDRATENLRINGSEIRAKIVGEGANLGMTQRGRIEYALSGGRLNTDAIDNSAGVDTSDHEVNIKILMRRPVDRKDLTLDARNKILASMTDDVAELVLRNNYLQTQALSLSEYLAPEFLPMHVRTIHLLEREGLLNRAVEFLPDSRQIAERQRAGKGLTRPELAVLLAYAKIWLSQKLLDSTLPDDPSLRGELVNYFPVPLQKKFLGDIEKHQLGREIIATVLTNNLVNRAGIPVMLTMTERTGKDIVSATRAYTVAVSIFGIEKLFTQIEELDNKVPAQVQTLMMLTIRRALSEAMYWLLTEIDLPAVFAPVVDAYSKGVEQLLTWLKKHPVEAQVRVNRNEGEWVAKGVPAALARQVALIPAMLSALDLTRLAQQTGQGVDGVADVFFDLGARLGIEWMTQQATKAHGLTQWQREALMAALSELTENQTRLAATIIGKGKDKKGASPSERLAQWYEKNKPELSSYDSQLQEWRGFGNVDLAMLTLAAKKISEL